MSVKTWSISSENRKTLITGAFEAKKHSYSPYSRFPVGAALLSADGTLIAGASIDNASYAGNICAEQTAIVKAVSEGKRSFIGLAVVADIPSPVPPCGICRQVIREFCSLSMPVLLVPGDYPQTAKEGEEHKPGYTEGGVRMTTPRELLPDSFGPEHL